MEASFGDQELIDRFLGGDERVFEELVERYRSRVFRLAMRFLKSREDAEEVSQEVFLTVYQKLEQFEGKSSFSTWLYRVTVNNALMRIRGKGQSEVVSIEGLTDDQVKSDEEAITPDDQIFTEQSLAEIEKVVEFLPYEFKTIVILRDIEGFSNEETAEIMNLSLAAVKSRIHRARAMLRQKLQDLYKQTMEG